MRHESVILEPVPEATKISNSNMKYSTALNRWFLGPIGIWPLKKDARLIEKVLAQIRIFMSYFLICFLIVPCSLHTFLEEENPTMKMKMIGPLSFCMMTLSQYSFLVARRGNIGNCLEHIDIDWRRVMYLDDREIMLTNAKLGRYIAWVSAVFMYGGGIFYHIIMPISAGSFTTPDNITIRVLSYATYEPLFTIRTSPSYEIVFTVQWLSGIVNHSVTTGACSLAAIFILHICGQFRIVVSRLQSFVEGRERKDSLEKRIAEIIELHLRALGFITQVEDILNEICLIEIVGSTLNICFLGYYFMAEFQQSETISTITYCVLLMSFTFNIFIFCYIGEQLTQHGNEVFMATYMIDWYKLPPKNAKDLILILLMTNYPTTITAGKISPLSFQSFSAVLRTAVAYLNFLRTMLLS